VGDELPEARRRERLARDQHARHVDHLCHGHQVAHRVDGQVGEYRRIDRDRADVAEEHRVAVGRGLRRGVDADVARGAGAVVDHDLLAEQLGEPRLHDAADEVRRAARGERNDHPDRTICIGLRECDQRKQQD
jgi:hypothetical protein